MEEQACPIIRLRFNSFVLGFLQLRLTDCRGGVVGSKGLFKGETAEIALLQPADRLTCHLSNNEFGFYQQFVVENPTDSLQTPQQSLFKDYGVVTFNLEILFPHGGDGGIDEGRGDGEIWAGELARAHLRKVEGAVMKKIQIQELRKTVRVKGRLRGQGIRSQKKNLTTLIVKQVNPKPAKHFKNINDSTVESISKAKITEESEGGFDGAESLPALPRLLKYYSSGENSVRGHERVPSRQEKEESDQMEEGKFEKIEELMRERAEGGGRGSCFARLLEEGTVEMLARQREVLQLVRSLMPRCELSCRVGVKAKGSKLRKVSSPYSAVRVGMSRVA